MTDQVTLTIPRAATPDPPVSSDYETNPPAADAPSLPPRRRRRLLPVFCATLAVLAALVTLAAPALRPAIAHLADAWLGHQNPITHLLSAPSDLEQRLAAREAELRDLTTRLAAADARVDRLAASQRTANADLDRALAAMSGTRAADETLSRTVDRLSQQADELASNMVSLDARVRAAGLLTLTLRLRRDLDAGLPIGQDVAALSAAGPHPARADRALGDLRRLPDGVPTMRDLADEFDGVTARLRARSDADTSWPGRSWSRLTTLFGASGNGAFVEHLHQLAMDGRFNEVAEQLNASPDADLAADWVARVHARATAVVAAQVLLDEALAAQQHAYSVQPVRPGGKLTQ